MLCCTASSVLYPLSLHDALPISAHALRAVWARSTAHIPPQARAPGRSFLRTGWPETLRISPFHRAGDGFPPDPRSEEHTSELQSQSNLVCRLLLEKKK